jgi:hypothetical protein
MTSKSRVSHTLCLTNSFSNVSLNWKYAVPGQNAISHGSFLPLATPIRRAMACDVVDRGDGAVVSGIAQQI